MKIYTLIEKHHRTLRGVFSSKRKAEAFIKNEYKLLQLPVPNNWRVDMGLIVEEFEVDQPLRSKQ